MASPQSSAEANLTTMHTFIREVQAKGDSSLFDSIIHPDFHDHSQEATAPQGREAARKFLQSFSEKLSGVSVEVVDCVSSGDVKILRATQAASGEKVEMRIMDFVRFEEGMFREHWANVQ